MPTKQEVKEFATRWIAALRSGNYNQCRGRLRLMVDDKPVGYCCLGVACEVARDAGIIKEYDGKNGVPDSWFDDYAPPLEPYPRNLLLRIDGIVDSATNFNDQGVPFDQIADAIERSYREAGILN